MPVHDHPTHPRTIQKVDAPYGCHNQKANTGNWASERCRYTMSLKDTRCAGCVHRGKGEKFAEAQGA